MATTLEGFAPRANKLAGRIGRVVSAVQREAGLDVHGGAIDATPVDTGKLRSNWLASVDIPRTDVIAPYFPGRRLGRSEQANRLAAISQGSAAAQALRPGADQKLWIVNNTPYVQTTNRQGTLTTTAGYVQRGIEAGLARFRKRKTVRL